MTPFNVLWITCDEMKASAVSVYGNSRIRMPAAERLAREGTRFDQAHVQVPKCIPVRGTFLTGRYPHVDGLRTMSRRDFSGGAFMLPGKDDPGLLKWLKGVSYTCGLAGKNHVLRHDQAPQVFEQILMLRPAEPPRFGAVDDTARRAYFDGRVCDDYPVAAFNDVIQTERMLHFLRQHHRERFFALLDISEPHAPYKEWPGVLDDLPLDDVPLPPVPPPERVPPVLRAWRASHDVDALSDRDRRRILRAYWGQCIFADRLVNRVLKELDALGLAQNTLVIWGSDHGDFAGEYGCYEKWDTALYDCITRVPLIMRLPGRIPAGRCIDELVELIDVAPTILDILGMPVPRTVHGRSLLPLLEGRTATHKEAVFSQGGVEPSALVNPGRDYEKKLLRPYWGKQRTLIEHPEALVRAHMVRTRTHKLIYRLAGGHELYDLRNDPGELENVIDAPAYAGVRADLEQRLLRFLAEHQPDQPSITELWA